jgi:hypothetical protein
MKPKKISQAKYLQALALFTVSHKYYAKSREMELELVELLGYDDNYCGCLSDEIYDGGNFDVGLKREQISVEPKKAKR